MEFLDSSQSIDADGDHTHLGEVLWGIKLNEGNCSGRMVGVCWEWREVIPNVVALSKILMEQHGGKVPEDREALEALPGVGRKTANVVLNVAFGEPTIAVDTHIFRVSNRTNLAPGKNVEEVEEKLEKVVPDTYKLHAHHWLILHGRYTCIARKPLCPVCVVRDLCRFKDKTKEPPPEKPKAVTKSSVAKRAKR